MPALSQQHKQAAADFQGPNRYPQQSTFLSHLFLFHFYFTKAWKTYILTKANCKTTARPQAVERTMVDRGT
jgi:hypothetical protein